MAEARPSTAYVWYVVGLVGLVNVVNYMDRMALAVLSPLIKADLGLSDGQLGLLVGLAFSLFYAVCGLPIARWADRGSRRDIIALAAAVWSVMTALCGAAQNFWHLLLARVGVGAGEAGSVSPGASVLCDYVPLQQRPVAMGILALGSAGGILLGMGLAGVLGDAIGWRATFAVLAIPGLVLALVVRTTLREPRRGAFDAAPSGDGVPTLRGTAAFLWHCRTYRALVVFLLANGFVQYGLNQWWPSYYAREFGLSMGVVGLNLGIAVGAFSGAGVLAGSLLAARLGRKDLRRPLQVSALAHVVAVVAALGSLFVGSFEVSIALVSLTAIGWGFSSGPVLAAQYSVVSSDIRATAGSMAVFLTAVLGFGFGPGVVGLVSDALAPELGPESLRYALLIPVAVEGVVVVALLAAARTLGADLRAVGALPPLPEASPGPTLSPSSAGARAAAIKPIEG